VVEAEPVKKVKPVKRERRLLQVDVLKEQEKQVQTVKERNGWLVFPQVKVNIKEYIGVKRELKLQEKVETLKERNHLMQDINVIIAEEAIIQPDVWLVGIGDYFELGRYNS
jgi:glutaredoxin-related protein